MPQSVVVGAGIIGCSISIAPELAQADPFLPPRFLSKET